MVALLCERLFVITFPFKAKVWATKRNALLLAGSVLLFSIIVSSPVIIGYNLVEVPTYSNRKICMPLAAPDSFVGIMIAFISSFSIYVYGTLFLCILTVILGVKLITISNQRKELYRMRVSKPKISHQGEKQGPFRFLNKNDLGASVLIMTLSIMQCILYIPCAFTSGSYTISNIITILTPSQRDLVVMASRFFLSLTIISKIWNIYIYLIRVPYFKEDLFKILTCNLKRTAHAYDNREAKD